MKYFISIFLSFICLNAFSQIKSDIIENGSRTIVTEAKNLYRGMSNATGFHLSYTCTDTDELFAITLHINEGKKQIDVNRKLLLKFQDGTILELANANKCELNDFVYPMYLLSKEDIQKIIRVQVIKIRIETDFDFIDKTIKKNKMSEGMKELYDSIVTQLSSSKEKTRDVYDNF